MAVQAQFPSSYGGQDWMENGFGGVNQFYFNVQQQKPLLLQQQQYQQCNMQPMQNQQQQPMNHSIWFDDVSSSLKNRDMASYEEKQRQEIDYFVRLQNERFRVLLKEQRRQQLGLLMRRVESNALPLLRQKDQEIAQAAKRTMELEDFLRKLEEENQAWQRVAQENEATVMSLNNTIEQLRENALCCFNNDVDDAVSCCDINREVETEEVNRGGYFDDNIKEEEEAMKMTTMIACKGCNSRNSCILFLPCRHLCSCKACEAFLDSCPVCQTVKKASIEALML